MKIVTFRVSLFGQGDRSIYRSHYLERASALDFKDAATPNLVFAIQFFIYL